MPAVPHYQKAELPPWTGGQALHEVPVRKLCEFIQTVVQHEAPVHESAIVRRLLSAFGLSRAGSRIVDHVAEAIRHGHRSGDFHFQAGFLYVDGSRTAEPRNRSLLDIPERKIELISPEELDAVLMQVVRTGFSINQDDAIFAAVDMLGFGRATSNIAAAFASRIDSLIAAGRLDRDEGRLSCSNAQQGLR